MMEFDDLLQQPAGCYAEAEKYINNLPKFAAGNGLERTKKYLLKLGLWNLEIPRIHIAGTNGKGSTCAYLQGLLKEYGFKVGGLISPHLVSLHERFLLDGRPVDDADFMDAFHLVYQTAKEATFFEFLFLMGMVIFSKMQVDVIVLETGLGGRLDATNVFDKTDVCVLTSIGLDHCRILGNSIEEIAKEKAGIIKKDADVVFLDCLDDVAKIFQKTAEKVHANVYKIRKNEYSVKKIKHKSIDFSYKSSYYNYISLTLSTYALYQVENATLALRAFETFLHRHHLTPMSSEKMQKVMRDTFWEGRMEEVRTDIFFDGAHNESGIKAFLETVASMECQGQRILCFSAMEDKDYEQMITMLCESGLFSQAVAIEMENTRGLRLDTLQRYFSRFDLMDVSFERGAEAGINRCLRMKRDKDQVFIVGSLYLVGLIKAVFRRKYND